VHGVRELIDVIRHVVAENRPGDLDIKWRDTEPIFVEVKGPGWKGELSQEALDSGRQRRPKYINAEARAVDPAERVEYAVTKALPKLAEGRINLLAVVDNLFFSPTEIPTAILNDRVNRVLAKAPYRVVAGVFLMNAVSYGSDVEYRTYFIQNPNAIKRLPGAVSSGLLTGNLNPHGPRRARHN